MTGCGLPRIVAPLLVLVMIAGIGCGGRGDGDDNGLAEEVELLGLHFAGGVFSPNTFTDDPAQESEVLDLLVQIWKSTAAEDRFHYEKALVYATLDDRGNVDNSANNAPQVSTGSGFADRSQEYRYEIRIATTAANSYELINAGQVEYWRDGDDEAWTRLERPEAEVIEDALDDLRLGSMLNAEGISAFEPLGRDDRNGVEVVGYRINRHLDGLVVSETEIWVDDQTRLIRGTYSHFYSEHEVFSAVVAIRNYGEPVPHTDVPEDSDPRVPTLGPTAVPDDDARANYREYPAEIAAELEVASD